MPGDANLAEKIRHKQLRLGFLLFKSLCYFYMPIKQGNHTLVSHECCTNLSRVYEVVSCYNKEIINSIFKESK